MTDELKATYEHWKEAAQKLDYFLVGLSAAIVSFEARDFRARSLGFNSSSLELFGIMLILCSMGFGLKRLRAFVSYLSRNHSIILLESDVQRREAALAAYDLVEEVRDRKSGALISKDFITDDVQRGQSLLETERGKWEAKARRLQRYYDWMSWCLVVGLLFIICGRVWRADLLPGGPDAVQSEPPCTTHLPQAT